MDILEFVVKVMPQLIEVAKEMYDLFDGDVDSANENMADWKRDIRDRRPEIERLRAQRKAEREQKRKGIE